jgi:hypothetical protein
LKREKRNKKKRKVWCKGKWILFLFLPRSKAAPRAAATLLWWLLVVLVSPLLVSFDVALLEPPSFSL